MLGGGGVLNDAPLLLNNEQDVLSLRTGEHAALGGASSQKGSLPGQACLHTELQEVSFPDTTAQVRRWRGSAGKQTCVHHPVICLPERLRVTVCESVS